MTGALRAVVVAALLAATVGGCVDDGRNVRSARRCTSIATGDVSVAVRLLDDSVTVQPSTTTAGRVAFVVRNAGREAHSFTVGELTEGSPRVVGSIDRLAPDEVCATAITLAPGDYVVYCDLEDHLVEGTHAPLHVTPT